MNDSAKKGKRDYREITKHFRLEGSVISAVPYGNGHINDTVQVKVRLAGAAAEKRYILQTINREIFPDADALMENIVLLTSYLKKQIAQAGGDPQRETLTPIETADGAFLYRDEEGNCWRMYVFITDAICMEQSGRPELFYESGVAFGEFQYLLRDFPAEHLHEVLPGFHDTPARLRALEAAVLSGNKSRCRETQAELAFVRGRRQDAGIIAAGIADGSLPLRVTHNDAKLNNVMLDEKSGKGLCVIDLDTVMPGSALYDYGDSIRSGASTALEDETDPGKIACSAELFEAYTKGFLKGCRNSLTEREISLLVRGAWTITLEQGVRFLTDYLLDDVYYKTSYPEHNLDRARNQLCLVRDMEQKWDQLEAIVKQAADTCGFNKTYRHNRN